MENNNSLNQNKIAHLQFIEDVIARMSNYSCAIKGICMAVVAGLSFLFTSTASLNTRISVCFSIVFLIICLSFLDLYYLFLEKQYRNLYNFVLQKNEISIDFNMNYREKSFQNSLNSKDKYSIKNYFRCYKSPSIWGFYGTTTVFIISIFLGVNFL